MDIMHASSELNILEKSGTERRLGKLIAYIEWSRSFTPSYLIVAVVILLLFTALNWARHARRRRRGIKTLSSSHGGSRASKDEWSSPDSSGGQSSSSSSTLTASESEPQKSGKISQHQAVDEETPLIQSTYQTSRRHRNRSLHYIRSFLMYQPAPIPAITASQNILPSNGTTVMVLLLFVPNLFYLFYRVPFEWSLVVVLADRAGLCFVVNLPILYLLGAKNQPLQFLIGRSYETLNIFHRRLGEWMTVLAVLHSVGMLVLFWQAFRFVPGFTFWHFLTRPIILLGVLTFFAYVLIYGTSIGYVRQLYYEVFLASHIFLQIAALVLLFFHHHGSRPYVIASAAIWTIDRILLRILLIPLTVDATAKFAEDGETILLSAKIPVRIHQKSWYNIQTTIRDGWQPSQHIFITIPTLGQSAVLQAHPYSVASSPEPISSDSEDSTIRSLDLIIRTRDGFTLQFHHLLSTHHASTSSPTITPIKLLVRIDGPYGSTSALEALKLADRTLLIAGGSGIAATHPLALILASTNPPKDRLVHYWIQHSPFHSSWITASAHMSSTGSPIHLLTDTALIAQPSLSRQAARETVLEEAVDWITQHGDVEEGQKVVVVVSGPDGLNRGVRNRCARLVREGWDIQVLVEKFGW